MNNKSYTREEKISYYIARYERLSRQLRAITQRLEYLQSENYQDWESELQKQLEILRSKRTPA